MTPARETSIEITAEDAAAIAEFSSGPKTPNSSNARSNNSSSVAKKFTKLIKPMSKNLHFRPSPRNSNSNSNSNNRPISNASDHATAGDLSTQHLLAGHGRHEQDNSSFNSESMGQMSVTPTVASLDTVKISNLNRQAQLELQANANKHRNGSNKSQQNSKKTTWKKLKQFMGLPPSKGAPTSKTLGTDDAVSPSSPSSVATAPLALRKTHSKSVDFPSNNTNTTDSIPFNRRRVVSMDFPSSPSKNITRANSSSEELLLDEQQQQSMLDDAVRGRLDGLDVMFLGPAHLISLPRQTNVHAESSTPWEPAPTFSFAGRSTQYDTKQIVTDMMIRSAGLDMPEIVLEGFFRDDRWIVTLDDPNFSSKNKERNNAAVSSPAEGGGSGEFLLDLIDDPKGTRSPPSRQQSSSCPDLPPLQLTDEEEHSLSSVQEDIPRHKLWSSMWGPDQKPPPKPSHMSSAEDVDQSENNILEVAASCSVPIDIDEDTFMVGNAQHLQAVHEIASAPLQHGRFEEAFRIFERILRGIQIQETNDAVRHLEGVTQHNMAVALMWQGNFTKALECIGKAINARHQYLPENHPDIAVSLVRQGYAYFALERFDLAIASFESALELFSEDSIARAKILNNIGVANYQHGDDMSALKNFSDALEIQRSWCQGPVRREAHVFAAAVMLGNMGKIHIKRGDYDLALSVYEEALVVSIEKKLPVPSTHQQF